MPLDFDKDSLFGDLVPDVFIKKITLETGFSTQPTRGKDPHIDIPTPDELPDGLKDLYEGLYEEIEIDPESLSAGNQDFNEIEVLDLNPDRPMKIVLDLVVKDTMSNNQFTTWFDNIDFSKLIKIRIVQSQHQLISEAFANQTQSIFDFNYSKIPNVPLEVRDLSLLSDSNGGYSLTIDNPLKQNTTKESVLSKFLEDVDVNGQKYYDIQFSIDFQFPSAKIEHLTYFAQTYIDPLALAQSFDPPLTELSPFEGFVGRLTFDPVFVNGAISETSVVYTDAANRIWLGPVFETGDDRLLKGREQPSGLTEEQLINGLYYLTPTFVPNIKIQDFRDIDSLESLDFDFNDLEQQLLAELQEISFTSQKPVQPILNDICTELWISRDEQNNCRMAFGVNLERLLKNTSPFSRIYENIPGYTRTELLSTLKLNNLRLVRKVINPGKENIEPSVLVGTEFNVESETGSIRELNLGFSDFRHFQCTDLLISKESDGIWEYVFSAEIEDVLPQFLSDQLQRLKLSYNIVRSFYLEASSPTNYSVQTDSYFINFIEQNSDQYETEIVPELSTYFNIIQYLNGPLDNFDKLVKTFNVLLHPRTGTPRGFETILNLIEGLIDKLESLLEGHVQQTNVQAVSTGKANTKKRTSSVFEYSFKETFNAGVVNKTGYDFLYEVSPNVHSFGLNIVSYSSFEERVNKEVAKYFNTNLPNIELTVDDITFNPGDSVENSKFGFISPIRILFANREPLLTLGVNPSNDKYNFFLTEILEYNNPDISSFSSKFTSDTSKIGAAEQTILQKLQTVLGGSGLSVSLPGEEQKLDLTIEEILFADPEVKGPAIQQLNFDIDLNNTLLTIVGFDELGLKNKTIKHFDLNEESTKEKMVELVVAAVLLQLFGVSIDPIKELPNQIKQLMLSFTNPGVVRKLFNTTEEVLKRGNRYFKMYMNYFNLASVEYLKSYETSAENKQLIKSPEWRKLTQNVFVNARDNNRVLFCRLKPYENKTFDISPQPALELPVLNQYFTLKNPDIDSQFLSDELIPPIMDFGESSQTINKAISDFKLTSLNAVGKVL